MFTLRLIRTWYWLRMTVTVTTRRITPNLRAEIVSYLLGMTWPLLLVDTEDEKVSILLYYQVRDTRKLNFMKPSTSELGNDASSW